ncbi:MAG: hypothetical protein HW385_1586 [candidate division NC10 bacterium]|nr:hypothetical protein [candidate division NC10 bacterium]
MVRKDQVRVLADEEVFVDLDVQPDKLVDLLDQGKQIDDHAVAQDADLPLPEDPGRDQVEDNLFVSDDDRMAGVGAALVTGHGIEMLREEIDDLALPLIAPLRADDDYVGHRRSPRSTSVQNRSMGTRSSTPAARSLRISSSWLTPGTPSTIARPIPDAFA